MGANGSFTDATFQALLCTAQVNLTCYVDDPLAAMRGAKADKMLHAATLMLVWEALGFGSAYPKGQLEDTVRWIGGTITVEAEGVRAKIKESMVGKDLDWQAVWLER